MPRLLTVFPCFLQTQGNLSAAAGYVKEKAGALFGNNTMEAEGEQQALFHPMPFVKTLQAKEIVLIHLVANWSVK